MKNKIEKIKEKLKDKKEIIKQANSNHKESFKSFFQACGIRTVNY